MNINGVKNITSGYFTISERNNGWVIFDLKKHRIICTVQDFPVEGKFCSRIRMDGKVYIPRQIEEQYGLYNTIPIKKIANNSFVIEKDCKGIMPKFSNFVSYQDKFVEAPIKYETIIGLVGNRILTLNRSGKKMLDLNATIKVHLGECQCIEILPNVQCENEFNSLKKIYGENMNRCDASYMEYHNPNTSDYQFCIPAFWAKQCNIERNDEVRVVVLEDGRVLITPLPKVDELTNETINPESEASENITICEECSESEDLGALILELKKMQELVASQHKTNEILRLELESCIEENNSLKQDVKSLKRMVRGLLLDR